MVFIKRDRPAPSAWWLVPVGVIMLVIGLVLLPIDTGYQTERWEFLFLVLGPVLVVWGVVAGLRGERLEK